MDRGELAGEVGGGEIEVAGEANNRVQEDGFEGVDGVGEGGKVGVGHEGEENTKYEYRNSNFEIRNKFEMGRGETVVVVRGGKRRQAARRGRPAGEYYTAGEGERGIPLGTLRGTWRNIIFGIRNWGGTKFE